MIKINRVVETNKAIIISLGMIASYFISLYPLWALRISIDESSVGSIAFIFLLIVLYCFLWWRLFSPIIWYRLSAKLSKSFNESYLPALFDVCVNFIQKMGIVVFMILRWGLLFFCIYLILKVIDIITSL
jgi:hypothetical protein